MIRACAVSIFALCAYSVFFLYPIEGHAVFSFLVLSPFFLSFENPFTLGCAYLNGWGSILGVQLFALTGMLFSIATMGDCSFVELDERLFLLSDLDENLPLKVTQTQYVGFLTWQMLDGYVMIFVKLFCRVFFLSEDFVLRCVRSSPTDAQNCAICFSSRVRIPNQH